MKSLPQQISYVNTLFPLKVPEPLGELPPPPAVAKCGRYTMMGVNSKHERALVRLFCKRWDCPRCGGRKREVTRAIMASVETMIFFRLQGIGMYLQAENQYENLLRRLRRRYKSLEYATFVCQKQGVTYFYLFLGNLIVNPAEIKALWADCGGGMVTKRKVTLNKADQMKEVDIFLKNVEVEDEYVRSFRHSKGFFPEIEKRTASAIAGEMWEWSFVGISLEALLEAHVNRGWKAEWINENVVILHPPASP
jgi:hypothetical protein